MQELVRLARILRVQMHFKTDLKILLLEVNRNINFYGDNLNDNHEKDISVSCLDQLNQRHDQNDHVMALIWCDKSIYSLMNDEMISKTPLSYLGNIEGLMVAME